MIKHVLFDLDGTIVDTNELIIESFLYVPNDKLNMHVQREEIIPHMGGTLAEQFRYFTGRNQVEEQIAVYREYNLNRHDAMVRLFPFVYEVIGELSRQGINLGVVTSKMHDSSDRVLRMFNLLQYLQTVITLENVDHPKPHPQPVQRAMQALGSEPEETLMIGDSFYDIVSAQQAGAKSAGVAWSLKGSAALEKYNPDWMLQDMRDLYDIVGLKRDEG